MRVTLYSKRRCSLCDNARLILEEVQTRHPFELVEHKIDDSPSLWAQFRYEVPVVFMEGERIAHHHLDPEQVEKRLLTSGTSVAQDHGHDVQKPAARGKHEGNGGGTL